MTKAEQIRQLKSEVEHLKKRLDFARTTEILLLEQIIRLKKEKNDGNEV